MHAHVLIAICVLLATATAMSTSAPATSTSAPTTSTSEPPSSTIPPGYTYYPATRSAYKYHHERYLSWHDANTTCAGEGAHVVVLNDAEEADIVKRIVLDAVGNYYYFTWTGLRDNRLGGVMDWFTVHGEPINDVYHAWGVDRPYNNAGTTCAVFSAYNKRLYDWSCDRLTYCMCEISQQ